MRAKANHWPTKALGKISKIQSGGTPDRKNKSYWSNGDIPWVTTAEVKFRTILETKEKITAAGLENSSAKVFPKGAILLALYGQGKTRGQVGLLGIDAATNQACAAIQTKPEVDSGYLYEFLKGSYSAIRNLSNTGGQENLSATIVSEIQVPMPPLPEQRKIAEILRTWDEAIEKLEALRSAKEKLYSTLADGLIFGTIGNDGSTWKLRRLGEVTRELTLRNNDGNLGRELVMGVTNSRGIVPMREQTIGSNLARYKILPPKAFAYNPMRINVGSIAMLRLPSEVLVSPDYVLFECIPGKLDPDYLDHLRQSHFWGHYINAGGSGSVRMRTYYDDLAALRLKLPEFEEQQKISAVLNTAQAEIGLLVTEIETLTRQKRGLMQKLLTGEWRVQVEEAA